MYNTYTSTSSSGSIFCGSTSGISSGSICTINGSTLSTITLASGSYFTLSQPKVKYTLMGETFEVEGNYSFDVSSFISLITVNGWRYYEEMLKNGISLTGDLKENIERMYLQHNRDQKIKDILETKNEE